VLDLLEQLMPANAPAVRDVFLAFHRPGAKEDFAWTAFWTRWGEVDGAAALEYFTAHPELGGSGAGTNAMAGFIGNDRTTARRWLNTHGDVPGFDVLARVYVENLARTDLSTATEELFALPLQSEQRYIGLGPIVLEALISGGMHAVDGWFAQLNDVQKKEAFIHTVWAVKDTDLDALTAWYSAQADKPWRDDKTPQRHCASLRRARSGGFNRMAFVAATIPANGTTCRTAHGSRCLGRAEMPLMPQGGCCRTWISHGFQRLQVDTCVADEALPPKQSC